MTSGLPAPNICSNVISLILTWTNHFIVKRPFIVKHCCISIISKGLAIVYNIVNIINVAFSLFHTGVCIQ